VASLRPDLATGARHIEVNINILISLYGLAKYAQILENPIQDMSSHPSAT